MKKLIYSMIILLCLCFGCRAQQKLQEGKFHVNGKTIVVTKNHVLSTQKDRFGVRIETEQKHYPDPKPNAFPVRKEDIHLDVDMIRKIIYDVAGNKRPEIAKNEGVMVLHVRLEQSGVVKEIYYTINNVPISLEEIEKMDKQIKKEVKATFTGKDYLDHYLINHPSIRITF